MHLVATGSYKSHGAINAAPLGLCRCRAGAQLHKSRCEAGLGAESTLSASYEARPEFGCEAGTDVAPSVHVARLRPIQLIRACGLYWRPESAGRTQRPSSGLVPSALESYRNFNNIGVRSFIRAGAPEGIRTSDLCLRRANSPSTTVHGCTRKLSLSIEIASYLTKPVS
jgi:hypothetical protein